MNLAAGIEAIRKWISESGISQADLARKSGLSPSMITLLLNGQRSPSIEIFLSLSKALGHTNQEILVIIGVIPPISPTDTPLIRQASGLLAEMDKEDLETAIKVLVAVAGDNDKRKKRKAAGGIEQVAKS